MKTRIIGTILVLAICFGLFVLTDQSSRTETNPSPVNNSSNDAALKSLSF